MKNLNIRVNLVAYLKSKNIWYKILTKKSTVHTADAAASLGLPLERITKSLVFSADERPILVIIPGTSRVDKNKLKTILNVKDVKIVPFSEAKRYSGYPPGATPPVHHKNIRVVIIDKKVMQFDTVYGGGGSRKKLIELKTEDIKKLNNGIIADVTSK